MSMLFIIFVSFLLKTVSIENSFYIYDWPQYLHNVYPPFDSVLEKDSSYSNDFNFNEGAGLLLNPEVGLFQTWQFSLYRNIMQRLLVSPFRSLYFFYLIFNLNNICLP
jgi:hypothetical protein